MAENDPKLPRADALQLQSALGEYFAPWVQALGLKVETVGPHSVTLRLPQSEQLSRVGGMLCGQAMMAAADTAMVLALIHHFGGSGPAPRCNWPPASSSRCQVRTRWWRRECCAPARRWLSARLTCAVPPTARRCAAPAPPTRCSEPIRAGPAGPARHSRSECKAAQARRAG